jgi:signal transduction histidine kinase
VLVVTGVIAWLLVSAPTWASASNSPRFPIWAAAWLVCGAALVVSARRHRLDAVMVGALALQAAAVATMVGLLSNGFEGMLLVFAAAQAGRVASPRVGVAWIATQTVVVAVVLGAHWTPKAALMLMPPYVGFQLFAYFATRVQRELAERSRLEERLRIARELHDVLGHHLTAMSLNLEVAAHQTTGAAHDNVRLAQSLARLLLGDVRQIVDSMQHGRTDLANGLAQLAAMVPTPAVHLAMPPGLAIADARSAHALLRCAQEFVTNSIRHAGARNVWLAISAGPSSIELAARDDGVGARAPRPGGGLSGMQARLEELGGTLVIESGDTGFAVKATVPA